LLNDYITKVGQIVDRQKKTVLTKGLQKDRQSIDNTVKYRFKPLKMEINYPDF